MDVPQFLKEAYVMKNFDHENVMGLIAICMDMEETPLVVLPYMEHGDLLSYLHEDKHVRSIMLRIEYRNNYKLKSMLFFLINTKLLQALVNKANLSILC